MRVPPHPANPDYGNQIFRRAIRIINRPGETTGELEDAAHAIRMRLTHDGSRVETISAEFTRYPMTTCPAATGMLDTLAGLPLTTPLAWFYGEGRARLHCTHMHDLAWWMMTHAGRDEGMRLYECEVPDHPEGRAVVARLSLNGAERLAWTVRDDIIAAPARFAGQNLSRGFVGWAVGALDGDSLEAAMMLHKAYFVSTSHKVIAPLGPLEANSAFEGACWSYTRPRLDVAERLHNVRLFPDGEGLLEFR